MGHTHTLTYTHTLSLSEPDNTAVPESFIALFVQPARSQRFPADHVVQAFPLSSLSTRCCCAPSARVSPIAPRTAGCAHRTIIVHQCKQAYSTSDMRSSTSIERASEQEKERARERAREKTTKAVEKPLSFFPFIPHKRDLYTRPMRAPPERKKSY